MTQEPLDKKIRRSWDLIDDDLTIYNNGVRVVILDDVKQTIQSTKKKLKNGRLANCGEDYQNEIIDKILKEDWGSLAE